MRIGVDGCRGGWFAAAVSDDGRWRTAVVPGFEEILGVWPDAELILVDIPIGLPAGTAPRRCDVEARRRLGPGRGSSVFPAPPRAVLDAASWEEALALARAASGRGISLQAWHLVPKIREVDALVRESSGRGLRGRGSEGRGPEGPGPRGHGPRIREAHPELLFQGLAGGEPVREPKRSPEGFARRLALLEGYAPGVGAVVDEALAPADPRPG